MHPAISPRTAAAIAAVQLNPPRTVLIATTPSVPGLRAPSLPDRSADTANLPDADQARDREQRRLGFDAPSGSAAAEGGSSTPPAACPPAASRFSGCQQLVVTVVSVDQPSWPLEERAAFR